MAYAMRSAIDVPIARARIMPATGSPDSRKMGANTPAGIGISRLNPPMRASTKMPAYPYVCTNSFAVLLSAMCWERKIEIVNIPAIKINTPNSLSVCSLFTKTLYHFDFIYFSSTNVFTNYV